MSPRRSSPRSRPSSSVSSPDEFIATYLVGTGARQSLSGADFRFGQRRSGDRETLDQAGLTVLDVEEIEGVSSTAIRDAVRDADLAGAAAMLGRPFELDGVVVTGDQRGGTLGYPTANIAMDPLLVCPRYGIYAGEALGHRAAISIGTNPHYGGTERRIEPFLLDFEGDLYGKRLVVELWERLRDEAVFDSEDALVEQIARDVEATRAADAPGLGQAPHHTFESRRRRRRRSGSVRACASRIGEALGTPFGDRVSSGSPTTNITYFMRASPSWSNGATGQASAGRDVAVAPVGAVRGAGVRERRSRHASAAARRSATARVRDARSTGSRSASFGRSSECDHVQTTIEGARNPTVARSAAVRGPPAGHPSAGRRAMNTGWKASSSSGSPGTSRGSKPTRSSR